MKQLGFVSMVLILGSLLSGCSLTPALNQGGLQVMTSDQPSVVQLNGQFLNKTPLIEKNLQPGEYQLSIRPDDTSLSSYETVVHIHPGALTVVAWNPGKSAEQSGGVIYEMQPLSDTSKTELSFVSIPDGAIIGLDDSPKEFSPVVLTNIPAGEHSYEVALPSFETQKHTLNAVPGYRIKITVKLAKSQPLPVPTPVPTPNTQVPVEPTTPATSSASGAVIIKPTGFTQDGAEILKVRKNPDSSAPELGVVPVGSSHPYLGITTNGWHKISFKNTEGWVSSSYSQIVE